MKFEHYEEKDTLVVKLRTSNLDAREAPDFKRQLIALIDAEKQPRVVVNIASLQFIDSSGLGSLLSVLRHLNSLKGDLKLANMTPPVQAIFELVRMHKLFEIYPSDTAAVESFSENSEH